MGKYTVQNGFMGACWEMDCSEAETRDGLYHPDQKAELESEGISKSRMQE
jgi:hypothetical protein